VGVQAVSSISSASVSVVYMYLVFIVVNA